MFAVVLLAETALIGLVLGLIASKKLADWNGV